MIQSFFSRIILSLTLKNLQLPSNELGFITLFACFTNYSFFPWKILRSKVCYDHVVRLLWDVLRVIAMPGFLQFSCIHSCRAEYRKLRAKPLDWDMRLSIALGSARGVSYLHHDCIPHIIHRDIKTSNILLDEEMEAHVADFGLAKLISPQETHVTTIVAGTLGYLPPGEIFHQQSRQSSIELPGFNLFLSKVYG